MPDEANRQGLVAFFASRPLLSLGASIASIISVPVAVYFYLAGVQSRDLKFYVNPATTTIVKSGESSGLRVLFNDQPVTTDVTGLQVEVWNAGKLAIHTDDILDPIVLHTSMPILEARVRHISRETTRFAIDSSDTSKGALGVSWKILEHDDGAVIQLIVAGENAHTTITGAVEGQAALSMIKVREDKWYDIIPVVVFGFAAMIVSIGVKDFLIDKRALPLRKRLETWKPMGFVLLIGLMIIAAFTLYLVISALYARHVPSVPLPFS